MASGISLNIKIGDKRYPDDPAYLKDWRHGQLVDIRPMGHYDLCKSSRMLNAIIDIPQIDFDTLRGTTDWKSTKSTVFDNWKKYLVAVDENGKYPWEFGYDEDAERVRRRDWFIDFKVMLNLGLIDRSTYDAILDLHKQHPHIRLDGIDPFATLFKHEDVDTRLETIKNQPYSSGTKTIASAGGDATDVSDAESKTAAQLTGDLTWEHDAFESSISSDVTFDLDTNTHLLKLTAQSGDEHNGGAYGNGARIVYGSYNEIILNETTNGELDDVEISKLAFDCTATGCNCLLCQDGGDSGTWTIKRCLMAGDSDSRNCINAGSDCGSGGIYIFNNIIYGFSNSSYGEGLSFHGGTGSDPYIDNNTVVGCYVGIKQAAWSGAICTVKNNLCQGNTTDYATNGAGWDTHSKNISEDATSPDAAYDNTDVHTNSVFEDYANDDYRLDSAGDATNLAIVDDGDDLSGTFTDDIVGTTRDTWYIGAYEIAAGGTDLSLSVSDTIDIDEAVTFHFNGWVVSVSDTLSIAETVNQSLPLGGVSVSDALALNEALTPNMPLGSVSVSDSISIAEAIGDSLPLGPVNISDAVSITDLASAILDLLVNVSDTIVLDDTIDPSMEGVVEHLEASGLSDTISLNEAVTVLMNLFPSLVDTISINEVVTILKDIGLSVSDTVGLDETVVIRIRALGTGTRRTLLLLGVGM